MSDIMSGLIWIQTVSRCDGIHERFFEKKNDYEKKSVGDSMQIYPECKIANVYTLVELVLSVSSLKQRHFT